MSISFSLKHANAKSNFKTNRARLDVDDEGEHEAHQVRDVPLSGKRKHDSVPQEAAQPKVIPLQPHSDWREDRKRRLGMRDKYVSEIGSSDAERDNRPDRAFTDLPKKGLVIKEQRSQTMTMGGDATPPAAEVSSRASTPIMQESPLIQPSDADALQALLSGEEDLVKRAPRRVIVQPSEEDMFRHDVDSRPDGPSLHDYHSMPVEEFGAAMLRGMGWKEGMGAGRLRNGPAHAPTVERRAALLGLGAKERPMPSSGDSRRRVDAGHRHYMPLSSRGGSHSNSHEHRGYDRHERFSHHSHHEYDRHRHRSSSHHHRHTRH